jgi:Fungal Zn(2)-Cys(6) binuclear cluster domain./Fungal specific transcription factor domain.
LRFHVTPQSPPRVGPRQESLRCLPALWGVRYFRVPSPLRLLHHRPHTCFPRMCMQTMENTQSTPVLEAQRSTAPLKRRLNVRQPLSCTVCRQRKSKCNRRLPCSACEKRQSPHLCAYNNSSQLQASRVSSSRRDDLSSQLEGLEALVQRHLAAGAPRPRSDNGPCLRAGQPSSNQSLAMSDINIQPGSTGASHFPPLEGNSLAVPVSDDTPPSGLCGALYSSDDGSVEYKVDRLHWSAGLSVRDAQHVSQQLESKSPVNGSNNSFPFYAAMPASVDALRAMIPPKQQRDYLVSRYFTAIAPLYHVLHEPKFCEDYSKFCRDPQSVPLSWLALLYVVLSLGTSTLEDGVKLLRHLGIKNERSTSATLLAAHFQDAAMSCLAADQFMVRHRLSTFQALTMLIYAMNNREGTGSTWALLGMHGKLSSVTLSCLLTIEQVLLFTLARPWGVISTALNSNLTVSRQRNAGVRGQPYSCSTPLRGLLLVSLKSLQCIGST